MKIIKLITLSILSVSATSSLQAKSYKQVMNGALNSLESCRVDSYQWKNKNDDRYGNRWCVLSATQELQTHINQGRLDRLFTNITNRWYQGFRTTCEGFYEQMGAMPSAESINECYQLPYALTWKSSMKAYKTKSNKKINYKKLKGKTGLDKAKYSRYVLARCQYQANASKCYDTLKSNIQKHLKTTDKKHYKMGKWMEKNCDPSMSGLGKTETKECQATVWNLSMKVKYLDVFIK